MRLFLRLEMLLLFTLLCFVTACDKDNNDSGMVDECEGLRLQISIDPICSFNPKTNQEVSFPVHVLDSDGTVITNHDLYQFSWSSDSDFSGSAISVTYTMLPLTIELTEIATGCVSTAELEATYWD